MERYKILAAILALGKFTADELAKISGIEYSTVCNTIASVKGEYIKHIGRKTTDDNGGQSDLYRIDQRKVCAIRMEIDALFNKMCGQHNTNAEVDIVPDAPLSLVVAGDIIAELVKESKSLYETDRLLALAEMNIKNVRAELASKLG